MFVVWLIGLALAVLAPVLLVAAAWRLLRADTRASAARALLGGLIGTAGGLAFSWLIAFVSEQRATALADYWYAHVAAGFTIGVLAAMATQAWRAAQARSEWLR